MEWEDSCERIWINDARRLLDDSELDLNRGGRNPVDVAREVIATARDAFNFVEHHFNYVCDEECAEAEAPRELPNYQNHIDGFMQRNNQQFDSIIAVDLLFDHVHGSHGAVDMAADQYEVLNQYLTSSRGAHAKAVTFLNNIYTIEIRGKLAIGTGNGGMRLVAKRSKNCIVIGWHQNNDPGILHVKFAGLIRTLTNRE